LLNSDVVRNYIIFFIALLIIGCSSSTSVKNNAKEKALYRLGVKGVIPGEPSRIRALLYDRNTNVHSGYKLAGTEVLGVKILSISRTENDSYKVVVYDKELDRELVLFPKQDTYY